MRIGIFARTFEGTDPSVVLGKVAEAGFSAAQYNLACSGLPTMPESIPEEVAAAVAAAAHKTGVELVALSGTYNMAHPDPAARAAGHARLAALAAASTRMGTRLITLCTGSRDPDDQWRRHPDNDTPEAWQDLLTAMEHAVSVAERHDLDLGIEPELANVVDSAVKARRLIEQIGSPRLKIVLDPANLFERATLEEQRAIVASAIELLADRIVMVHAKDRTPAGGFTAAGLGVLDYAHYVARLKAIGFDGPIITHGLSASEAPRVAVFLRRALDELVGVP